MKTSLPINRVFSVSSFLSMLKDLIKDGYTIFYFKLENNFILSNQYKRNSKKCSFKCDQELLFEDDKITTLIETLESSEKKYILTNDLSFNASVNFK